MTYHLVVSVDFELPVYSAAQFALPTEAVVSVTAAAEERGVHASFSSSRIVSSVIVIVEEGRHCDTHVEHRIGGYRLFIDQTMTTPHGNRHTHLLIGPARPGPAAPLFAFTL